MVVSGTRDQRIAAIASAQRGRLARWQLHAAGLSDSAIARRVASGRLHREHRGVYAVGHATTAPLADETSALLACGERTVLSHVTAAGLWIPHQLGNADRTVDVTACARQTGRPSGVRVHRTRDLSRRDVRMLHGLPVTSPARTLLDVADVLTLRLLERALDEALDRRLVRLSQVREVLGRAHGRRGAPVLAALLDRDHCQTITRSEWEERLLALVRQADLPTPELNARLHGYLVDAVWREHALVVEVDGWDYHSSRSAFERDRAKSAKLTALGFHVIRVTACQLREEPFVVIGRIAQALGRAAARKTA
jgi:very-short-patch-repair endonuclease